MHLNSRQNKNRTYKNYNSNSIKKGKDTRAHWSPRLLPELARTLNSTPDRASPTLLLNNNLYKWRTKSIVWCVEFHRQGVFIGVPGAVTKLIKSVIHHVLAGRPSHVVGQPSSSASTDSWPLVPFHRLLESVTAKETPGRLQSGAGWPGSLAGQPPTGPTRQWPFHTTSSCQVYTQSDTYFSRIPNFLVISWNALTWHLCSWN
jgi:hypothetical protein